MRKLLIVLPALLLAACGQNEKKEAGEQVNCQPGGQSLLQSCTMKSCMQITWGKTLEQTINPNELLLAAQVAQETMENGVPGQAASWKSCSVTGSIIPTNYYQTRGGQHCREYALTMHIVKGSTNMRRHGLACRKASGIWETVREE